MEHPEGMLDGKNVTAPQLSMKKCRGKWFYLPFNCLLKLLIKVWSLMAHYLPQVAVMSSPWSCPHSTGVNIITWQHSWKRKSPSPEMVNSTSLPFSKSPPCPQLIQSAKMSQLWASSEDLLPSGLPPLCSIKSVWIFSGVSPWLFLVWETQEL